VLARSPQWRTYFAHGMAWQHGKCTCTACTCTACMYTACCACATCDLASVRRPRVSDWTGASEAVSSARLCPHASALTPLPSQCDVSLASADTWSSEDASDDAPSNMRYNTWPGVIARERAGQRQLKRERVRREPAAPRLCACALWCRTVISVYADAGGWARARAQTQTRRTAVA